MRSEYSTGLWLRVRTSRVRLLKDEQILKLGNVLIVQQKNKLTVQQKNSLAVRQKNVTAVSHFREIIYLIKTDKMQLIKWKYLST
jgi:hypothetical protein